MRTIAIVDDSPATLELVERVLRSAPYDVASFKDGVGLEDEVERIQPELILLDIVMPGRNGYEILRKLGKREATAGIPVVLMSSKAEPHDVEWGLRQGAAAYLPKPFSASQLIEVVNGALG